MKTVWTPEQTAFLKANYETMKTKELLATLTDKSNDQLRWKAKEFKLKKRVTRSKGDMTWLEDFDSPETCYWWGFITADGCINHRQLIVAVHERDEGHLSKFCKKTGTNISRSTRANPWNPNGYTMVRTCVEDMFTLPKLKETLKIQPRKTYNPLDLNPFMTPSRLAYFMAGLIDGDGYLAINLQGKKSVVAVSIKVHPNWTSTFQRLSDKMKEFYGIDSSITHTKEGWVVLKIHKRWHILELYHMINGRVPRMDRKWSPLEEIKIQCEQSTDNRLRNICINPSAHLFESGFDKHLAVPVNLA